MDNREDHPRVSVGTVHDWQQLKSYYREAFIQALTQIASTQGLARGQNIALAHMDQWIERTFSYAQPNLRINGNAFESLDDSAREMEPFDEALDRRIWSLADTRLQWHKRIAEARRTIPSEIEANTSRLREQHRELDTARESHPDEDMEERTVNSNTVPENLEDRLHELAALSHELCQTTTLQKERAERLRVTAAEVQSLGL